MGLRGKSRLLPSFSIPALSLTTRPTLPALGRPQLALPPPVLRDLDHAHLVSTYLLHFLQGFVLAGGAPELAPFLRAIAAYFDLEWDAIRSQDKGKGVVVAATWLIPVALVPRPWDFGDARD